MNAITYPTRIFTLTRDQAADACAQIGYMVQQLGLRGIQALRMEQSLYTTLYEESLECNATPAALEYIENRRRSICAQLETVRCCDPDLFDDYVERHPVAPDVVRNMTGRAIA